MTFARIAQHATPYCVNVGTTIHKKQFTAVEHDRHWNQRESLMGVGSSRERTTTDSRGGPSAGPAIFPDHHSRAIRITSRHLWAARNRESGEARRSKQSAVRTVGPGPFERIRCVSGRMKLGGLALVAWLSRPVEQGVRSPSGALCESWPYDTTSTANSLVVSDVVDL